MFVNDLKLGNRVEFYDGNGAGEVLIHTVHPGDDVETLHVITTSTVMTIRIISTGDFELSGGIYGTYEVRDAACSGEYLPHSRSSRETGVPRLSIALGTDLAQPVASAFVMWVTVEMPAKHDMCAVPAWHAKHLFMERSLCSIQYAIGFVAAPFNCNGCDLVVARP